MPRRDFVVPVGDNQQCSGLVDPAAEIAKQVERRFVRPMDVFDDNQRWTLGRQRIEHGCEEVGASFGIVQHVRELVAKSRGNIEQGPKWTRGGQGIAGPDKQAHRAASLVGEAGEQRGFADSSLAAHDDQATCAVFCPTQMALQLIELARSLQEIHESIL